MREKNSERPDTRDNRSKNSTKTGKKKKNTKNREFAVITYSFLALFICLMGYFSYFQFFKSEEFINNPYNTRQETFAQKIVRGQILTNDGQVLAETVTDSEGNETRRYPYGSIFSHIVGYSTKGKSGIESLANFNLLRSNTAFIDKVGDEMQGEKSPGDNVVTTLDYGLQATAYDALGYYTRGVERSRDPQTILSEALSLFENGYREVTLLGQNVNSYRYGAVDFPELMRLVSEISPLLRVRFATSHPKDMSDRLLEVMASKPNICRCIHLPAQSGSSRMLEKMNRKYTREWYLDRIAAIRRYMPDCAITTDLIAGFCSETDEDHRQTLSLMREVGYEFAYMFKYSERPDTFAQRHMPDDVPDSVKTARLNEIIALQNTLSAESNARDVGKEFEILVEGTSKRSDRQLFGRTSQNKVVVFDRGECRIGDYVRVRVTASSSATLQGELVERTRPFEV